MKKEILIIFGGRSGEHEVSLQSAASVYNHLDRKKYSIHLIGITKEGKWYLQDNPDIGQKSLLIKSSKNKKVSLLPMEGFLCKNSIIKVDIVIPLVHGTFGEDGKLQGLLEMAGFPYIGSNVGGSYLAMDKDISKMIWQSNKINTVPYRVIKKWQYPQHLEQIINKEMIKDFGFPLFVKPSKAGSSVGVAKAENEEELSGAIIDAFLFDTKVIVEPAIIGREIECSVIGNNTDIESFPPGEVAPTHDYYDYNAKYIDPDGAGLIIPAEISKKQSEEIQDIAKKAFKAIGLKGFARVDFFLEEKSNKILLNEANTIPGFTNISMFAKLCENGGLPFFYYSIGNCIYLITLPDHFRNIFIHCQVTSTYI